MGTEIILVRHAIAYERDRTRWRDDRQRPLTPGGKQKFRKAAAGLAKWIPTVDCIFTSPLARARQTAELLTEIAGWPEALEAAELAPEGSPTAVLSMLRTQKAKRIALVGHEPGLSELLAACIAGSAATLPMKKGGIACVVFSADVRNGKGTLSAFVPPRLLRKTS
jgi:phosphohistidine phosphatase